MRKIKSFMSALLCTVILTSGVNAFASENRLYDHQNNSDKNSISLNTQEDSPTAFPEKYDLRELKRTTPAKAQGELGSCWALASIGALESSLKTSEEKEYDLSENNLVNTSSNIYQYGFDREYYNGGDDAMAAAYYASWEGPVLEEEDPYSEYLDKHTVMTGLKPVKHVQDIVFLPERKNPYDNSLFKEYIMKYGGISSSMWKGTPQTFGEFYNEDKFAWYYPYTYMNKEGNGHAVTIIGWDDKFPKESFSIEPPGDGAFIVKNTKGPLWGQKDRSKNIDGYFYISYYDMMLGSKLDSNIGTSVFTRVDAADNYSNIYQYDILGYTKSIKQNREISFANVFKVNKGNNEKLSAVSFYTLEENLQYEVWINTRFTGTTSFYSMTKAAEGTIKLPGYHTIDFTSKYDLDKNANVAVMIKLKSNDKNPSMAIESPYGLNSSRARAAKGESYYFKNNYTWVDLTSVEANSNACIKMFTENGETDTKSLLSVDSMKADVDYIVSWISEHQPVARKYGFTEKQQAIIDSTYSKLNKPITKDDFYLIINRLFTMMGDGHTRLYYQFQEEKYISLPFIWLEDGIYVNKTLGRYVQGDKILSIGGKKPEELNSILYDQISSENDYYIHAQAPFYLIQEQYLKYYNMINNDKTVDIEIEREGKRIVIREPLSLYRGFSNSLDRKWLSWRIEKENNLGYFQFDMWEKGEKLDEIKKNMDDFFKEVINNNIGNIVIDLRENPGGTSQTLDYLLKYLDTGDVYDQNNEIYSRGGDKHNSEYLFRGNTYVMTSNRTFSCSVFATTILKDNGIVRVIGEPTGENPAFNKHGSGADGILPNTGWRFMMTSTTSKRPLGKDNSEKAIFPDIPVYTTIDDIISGRDIQMVKMREITRKDNYIYADKIAETNADNSISIVKADSFGIDEDNNIMANTDIGSLNKSNIWIEYGDKRNIVPVVLETSTDKIVVKAAEKLKEDTSNYLILSYNGIKHAVPLKVKPMTEDPAPLNPVTENEVPKEPEAVLPISDASITHYSYSAKWNYWMISFSEDLKYKDFDISKSYLIDSNGMQVGISVIGTGSTQRDCLIVVPEKKLTADTYILFIPAGTIETADGQWFGEDINITYTIE